MRRIMIALVAFTLYPVMAWSAPTYKILCQNLPDLPGWRAQQCEGSAISNPMMGGEVVTASRKYTKDDTEMDVAVISGAQAMIMWAPYNSGITIENSQSLNKVEMVDGFRVGINYDKRTKSGILVILLKPTAIVGINFRNLYWQDTLRVAKALNWKKLQSLFP